MSTTDRAPVAFTDTFLAEPVHEETPRHRAYRFVMGLTRLGIGFIFLWAFLDKLLALGFGTGRNEEGVVDRFGDAAWINGASPTEGFLTYGTKGPLKDFYSSMAGQAWADWLFMAGLLGIGLALTLGIAMRIATATGSLLLIMMWSAALWPENNPFVEADLIYAIVLVALALAGANKTLGFGRAWERIPLVQRYGFLK